VDEDLTPLEREILAFEKQRWQHAGAKAQAIYDLFGWSATRYHQAVNVLIDKPAALAVDPTLVNRLRRLRQTRRSERARGLVRF
jgi:hypothetical protein